MFLDAILELPIFIFFNFNFLHFNIYRYSVWIRSFSYVLDQGCILFR